MGIHFRMRVGAASERWGCRAAANPSRVETDRAEGGADGRTTELKYCATLIGFLGEHRTVRRGAGREAGSGLLADRQKCVAVASVTHRVAV